MSTIVISPLTTPVPATRELVRLEILVANEDFEGLFDVIEVWRSSSGEGGPYEELTAASWRPARMPKTGGDQPAVVVDGPLVNIVGKTLSLKLKEQALIEVTFTGSDPLTNAQVATQITVQSAGRLRSYVDEDAVLVIETLEPGVGAALRVLASDAAFILALPTLEPDAVAFGHDARIALVLNQSVYLFNDVSETTQHYYKTRFRNRAINTTSDFSLPFGPGFNVGVELSSLVVGYLDLVTGDGKPITGREVSLYCSFNGNLVDGKLVASETLTRSTDGDGRVEFNLVRGQKYTLAVSGMNLAKEVVAPTDLAITSFLLVDPAYSTEEDYFRVRVPNIPTLERRTL